MDVRMPVMDDIDATRSSSADPALAGVRVLVLTTFEIDDYVFGALRAGASGFPLKDVDAEELHAAVRTVAAGYSLLAPAITRRHRRLREGARTCRPATRATRPEGGPVSAPTTVVDAGPLSERDSRARRACQPLPRHTLPA